MSSDEKGKWFWRVGFWVAPRTVFPATSDQLRHVIRTAGKAFNTAQREFSKANKKFAKAGKRERKSLAEIMNNALGGMVRAFAESESAHYNAQPRWRLADVLVESDNEAVSAITEFAQMARAASGEYCWGLTFPSKHARWTQHAWKHVCYHDLEEASRNAKRSWMPELRVEAAVGSDKVEDLIKRAIQREPGAVAAVDFLLPSEEDKLSATRSFCSRQVSEVDVRRIPSVHDLAGEFVEVILRDPESTEADTARRQLRHIMARKVLTQGLRGRGRPRETHHPELVQQAYVIGNAIFRQIREVEGFLRRHVADPPEREDVLARLYPWINRVSVHGRTAQLLNLLTMSPSEAAIHIASDPLALSPSKIEKLVHRKRTR